MANPPPIMFSPGEAWANTSESPVSAYMRYLQNSLRDYSGPIPNQPPVRLHSHDPNKAQQSPISAYMRYLQNSLRDYSGPIPNQPPVRLHSHDLDPQQSMPGLLTNPPVPGLPSPKLNGTPLLPSPCLNDPPPLFQLPAITNVWGVPSTNTMASVAGASFSVEKNHQQLLKSLIEGARESWTYAIFWESSHKEYTGSAMLSWGDGYYNGEEDEGKRKNSAPASSLAEQEHRKKVLRELNSLIAGPQGSADDAVDEEVTDTEWFFIISMPQSFATGRGLPGQALYTSNPVWVTGAERLASSHCERARQAQGFGLRTLVCIPSTNGIVELGSTEMIFQSSDLLNKVRILFNSNDMALGLNYGLKSWSVKPEDESESRSSVGNFSPPIAAEMSTFSGKSQWSIEEDSDCSDLKAFARILKRRRRKVKIIHESKSSASSSSVGN